MMEISFGCEFMLVVYLEYVLVVYGMFVVESGVRR